MFIYAGIIAVLTEEREMKMEKVLGIILCLVIFVSAFAGMSVIAADSGAVSFYQSDYVKIAGTISPEDIREEDYTFEGKDVTLTLVNKSTGNVDYLSQTTLDEDGNFEFGFYQDGLTYGNDAAYKEMDRIMAYFMSRNDIVFMTPSQYYDYKYSK